MPRVLFDASHDNNTLKDIGNDGFNKFGAILTKESFKVSSISKDFMSAIKTKPDVLVIAFPKESYKPEEVEAIHEYVKKGGGLLVAGEWGDIYGNLYSLNEIVKEFGFEFQKDRVTDMVESYAEDVVIMGEKVGQKKIPQFIKVKYFSPHSPITKGIEKIILFAACSIKPKSKSNVLAYSSRSSFADKDIDGSWDEGEKVGPQPLIVQGTYGNGRIVCIGDTSIFTNKYIEMADHTKISVNMVKWLSKQI